jgi:hypothetical protein
VVINRTSQETDKFEVPPLFAFVCIRQGPKRTILERERECGVPVHTKLKTNKREQFFCKWENI